MFKDDRIAGSWPRLTERIQSRGKLIEWAAAEPVFTDVHTLNDLLAATRRGADLARSDRILGALVRLAAADSGDDEDALLLLLHLLSDGAANLARYAPGNGYEAMSFVVAELALTIRSFPWRRRTRAFGANLLRDTQSRLMEEIAPRRQRRYTAQVVPVDPLGAGGDVLGSVGPSGCDDAELDLEELFAWAARTGVANARDLAMLLELERLHRHGAGTRLRVAAEYGIHERTLRRRRARALDALRAAREDYLRDVS